MLVNKQLITDPKCVAETFNNYFCDVAASDGAQMSVEEFKDHPSVRKIVEHFGPTSNFDFQLIEVEYVKSILLKLNPRKAVGCDNISPWDVTTYRKDSCVLQLPPLHSR